jgi:hypothetical protein
LAFHKPGRVHSARMVNRRFRKKIPHGFEMVDSARARQAGAKAIDCESSRHNFGKIRAN